MIRPVMKRDTAPAFIDTLHLVNSFGSTKDIIGSPSPVQSSVDSATG
jgi:hypothetical protein